jgi:hypothetical protein
VGREFQIKLGILDVGPKPQDLVEPLDRAVKKHGWAAHHLSATGFLSLCFGPGDEVEQFLTLDSALKRVLTGWQATEDEYPANTPSQPNSFFQATRCWLGLAIGTTAASGPARSDAAARRLGISQKVFHDQYRPEIASRLAWGLAVELRRQESFETTFENPGIHLVKGPAG